MAAIPFMGSRPKVSFFSFGGSLRLSNRHASSLPREVFRRIIVSTPPISEGGAGRRRLAGLHGLMCESGRSTSEVFTAVAGNPGIPRAVFEAFLHRSPGGVTKPSFWERPFYPPLAGSLTGCAVFGIRAPQTRRGCGVSSAASFNSRQLYL